MCSNACHLCDVGWVAYAHSSCPLTNEGANTYLIGLFGGLEVTQRAQYDSCRRALDPYMLGHCILQCDSGLLEGVTYTWHILWHGCWASWVTSNWWVVFLSKCCSFLKFSFGFSQSSLFSNWWSLMVLGSSSFDIIYCHRLYLALTLGGRKKPWVLSLRLVVHIGKVIKSLDFRYTWISVTNTAAASL